MTLARRDGLSMLVMGVKKRLLNGKVQAEDEQHYVQAPVEVNQDGMC